MSTPHCAHQANAETLTLEVRDLRVDWRRREAQLEKALEEARAAKKTAQDDAERLADLLHQEQQAHEQTRQALVSATARAERAEADCLAKDAAVSAYFEHLDAEHEEDCPEDSTCACSLVVAINKAFGPGHPGAELLDGTRKVETAARAVLAVCDTPTTQATTEERLRELDVALLRLRMVLGGQPVQGSLKATVANLIVYASFRAGGQGRDFDAHEAAELIVSWLSGRNPLEGVTLQPGEAVRGALDAAADLERENALREAHDREVDHG